MKIFLDSSDINEIRKWKDRVDGFTTNPTLMRKAGITDYEKFCKEVLAEAGDKPVSFEVFADEFGEMERQARIISSWGKNIYVKIPVMDTKGEKSYKLIAKLANDNIKINITAVTDYKQLPSFSWETPTIVSVFAGRIMDTGQYPDISLGGYRISNIEVLWASPREVYNIYQANNEGADIITCTPELLEKYYKFKGMDLNELSLMTVKMFYDDAVASGFKL